MAYKYKVMPIQNCHLKAAKIGGEIAFSHQIQCLTKPLFKHKPKVFLLINFEMFLNSNTCNLLLKGFCLNLFPMPGSLVRLDSRINLMLNFVTMKIFLSPNGIPQIMGRFS